MAPKASSNPYEDALASAKEKMVLTEPLVWQVFKLNRAEYLAWVHEAMIFDGSAALKGMRDARLFQWDFMEPLSRTVWWVIPLVWLPVAAALSYSFVTGATYTLATALTLWVSGLIAWTLVEYSVHRFVFHLDDYVPDAGVFLLIHFLLHGIHHKVPMDRYRLVMPPALFAILAGIVYAMLRPLALAFLSVPQYHMVFAGAIAGYVIYDLMHFSQHHVSFKKNSLTQAYFYGMKQYHMKHHYSGLQNVGYGITTKFWDMVFGTVLDIEKAKKLGQGKPDLHAIAKDD